MFDLQTLARLNADQEARENKATQEALARAAKQAEENWLNRVLKVEEEQAA